MESKVIGLVGIISFANDRQRNSFLLTSRSAFADYKYHNNLDQVKQDFKDKEVIDFIERNKELSLEEFTTEIQKIIG